MNKPMVTVEDLAAWIERQKQLGEPSPNYIEWLRRQIDLKCHAEVIKHVPGIEKTKHQS